MANKENIDIKLNIDGGAGIKSVGTIRKEVKSMIIELQELETEANRAFAMGDDAAVSKAKARHAERTAQMEQLKNDAVDIGNRNKLLDPGELLGSWVKLGQGVMGAFSTITAGMKLMGSENETVNAIAEKSATVIQMMMGLESARQMLIDAGGVKNIAMLVKQTAVQWLQVGASTAQTVATGAVTAAQWLLNIAMSMNPIGLVVLAVAGLIAGFWLLVEATGSVTEALMWMVNPVGMLVGLLLEEADAEEANVAEKEKKIAMAKLEVAQADKNVAAVKKVIASMESELATMKARGASESELFAKTQLIHDQKIKLAQTEADQAAANFKLAIQQGGMILNSAQAYIDAKNRQNEAQKAKDKEISDRNDANISAARARAEEASKQAVSDRKAYARQIEDISVESIKNESEREIRKLEVASRREIDALNKNAKNYEEIKKALEEKLKLEVGQIRDVAAKDAEENQKSHAQRLLQIDIDALQMKLDASVDSAERIRIFNEISAKEQTIAESQYAKDNADLMIKDREAYEKGLSNLSVKYSAERTRYAKDAADETVEMQREITKSLYTELQTQIADEEDKWNKLIEDARKYGLATEELERKKTAAIQKIKDDAAKDAKDKELAGQTEYIQKVSDGISAVNDLFQQASQTKLDNIDIEYSERQARLQTSLDNGIITQAQFDEKSAQLDREKNNKLRAEKEKAWKIQHAADIANAIATGTVATLKAYAAGVSVGGPLALVTGGIFAGIAGAMSAVQIGILASQKMPKFAKGGMVGGQSHAAGGTILEAEAGEFIVNRNAMSNPGFASIVKSINSAGNSAPMPDVSSFSGGSGAVVSTIDPSVIDQIVSRIASIPVNVTETDITRTQKKVSVIENRSIIG